MSDIPEVYKHIFTDDRSITGTFADDEAIAKTLKRYVVIYPDFLEAGTSIKFLPSCDNLTVLQKVILYFLIVRALYVAGFRDDELVRPIELTNHMKLNGNSARPFLGRLSRKENRTVYHSESNRTYELVDYKRAVILLS